MKDNEYTGYNIKKLSFLPPQRVYMVKRLV